MLGFNAISAAAIASLVTSGAISGTATITFSQTGDVVNQGSLSGSASFTLSQTGDLKGAGSLAGTVTATFSQTGTVVGSFSLLGSTSFAFSQTGTLTNANAGTIWQNPDGMFVFFGTTQADPRPEYATDTTPYLTVNLRYDQPNRT